MPVSADKAIDDLFEKYNDLQPFQIGEQGINTEDILNESGLYLSSNWSTGHGGCAPHDQIFLGEKDRFDTQTQHEQLVVEIPIPGLDVK